MITQTLLKERFNYNPESGVFTRKYKTKTRRIGSVIGSIGNGGYIRFEVNDNFYQAHRLAWLYVYGESPNTIDHIDGNRANNVIANLRNVTHVDNSRNQRRLKNNITGCTGIYFNKTHNVWRVSISLNNKTKYLGSYRNKTDAIIVRKMAEYQYGFHYNHGGVREDKKPCGNYRFNINKTLKGVSYNKKRNRWVSQLSTKFLGYSIDYFEACCLRKSAEINHV